MTGKDEAEPVEDRRGARRQLICVPSGVASEHSSQQVALIRDLSVSGAYLLTHGLFDEGLRLELSIHIGADGGGPTKQISGKVVRAEKLSVDRADLWSCGAAVRFDELLTGLDEEIDALAERLKSTGLFADG